MEDVHGKEIDLQCTTVKYAGQHRPRVPATNGMLDMMSQMSMAGKFQIKKGAEIKSSVIEKFIHICNF